MQWTTCASFFDAPGYGTQTVGRHFRLESEPGRARSSGADRETGEGDERAIFPVGRHVPTGGKNSRKSSIALDQDVFMPILFSFVTREPSLKGRLIIQGICN